MTEPAVGTRRVALREGGEKSVAIKSLQPAVVARRRRLWRGSRKRERAAARIRRLHIVDVTETGV